MFSIVASSIVRGSSFVGLEIPSSVVSTRGSNFGTVIFFGNHGRYVKVSNRDQSLPLKSKAAATCKWKYYYESCDNVRKTKGGVHNVLEGITFPFNKNLIKDVL
jgi:hypothetical protein